jgi:dipeptidyl aminopeptidase/acylaminoacyl peptidase
VRFHVGWFPRFACAFAIALACANVAQAAPLTFAEARAIVAVSAPQISPDGTRVVYVRTVGDYAADRWKTSLVLVDTHGGTPHVLTQERGGVSEPRWSPQGDRVAFLAAPQRAQPPQVYVLWMGGGDAQKITSAKTGVQSFSWRPDGKAIAYVAADEAPNAKDIEAHNDAFSVTDEDFLTREKVQPSHLWLIDADGAHAKRLNSGTWSVTGEPQWSPDGATLIFAREPDAIFAHFTKQYTVAHDMTTGAEHPLLGTGPNETAAYAPDGTKVVSVVPRHGSLYLQRDLAVYGSDGAPRTSLAAIDRNVHWAAWMPDSKTLAVGTADGVRNVLWMAPLDGPPQRVDLGDVDFGPDASVAHDGGIAFVGQSRTRPSEVYYLAPGAKAPIRLSDDNAKIAKDDIGPSQLVEWTTDDGLHADGVLTLPPNADPQKKFPLVLIIHGGPVSTSTWNFSVQAQELAGRGYAVFQPNYRGSDNLGDAYLQAIVGHVTSGPGRDNLAGLAAVEKLPMIDATRVGVSGWSGGGLQTSWLIGHTHVFKTAVSGAAVNDWYEQAVLADINEEFAATFFPGVSPFTKEGRAAYNAESPITFARNITTPLLILSDTGDQRVPITQAYALYHALADRGGKVTFIAFPRAGHFPSDPVGREMAYRTWNHWFDRWLK